ncbi:methyltransferase domain-containing protein [Simiduia sp. 21SJ11W-1]|uniref:methyltransferase domain-containing protein n=1 Tax=Simiduia sp. 21SJ11W-1 TaxID=2909669 RepID=UPI0020A08A88|nr:methyltransferase domain-containing protein [Simiduia sp. 21SJ11W-1]UTA46493.1 methyltransferase domain-containing protein [Simiduia sp. 21SJ11W-1]
MTKQNPAGSKRPPIGNSDRNFDDLAPRFARNVYGGLKGQLRLAVLERDFEECIAPKLTAEPLEVLDAGGGQGQFSLQFARRHKLVLCDISEQMLALAKAGAEQQGVKGVEFLHKPVQALAEDAAHRGRYHLVLCHAVLEWVADQQGLLAHLKTLVRPGGVLSLTFYNRHGLIMKNLLRGVEPTLLKPQEFRPHRGSLTPTRPLEPAEVMAWLLDAGWQCLCHSGIRVFHDYQLTPESQHMAPEALKALELKLSREEPYRSLGRYQHLLLQRPE